MLNLSVLLEHSARKHPNSEAFVFMDTSVTYAQVNGAANQIANGLKQLGISPGDKVALSCLNLPYFPMVYFGILKAGAVCVPLSVLLKRDEIAYHLSDSDAKAYFCFTGTPDLPMAVEGNAGFGEAKGCDHFIEITAKPTDAYTIKGARTLGSLMTGQPAAFPTHASSAEDTAVIVYTSGTTGKPKGAELTHSNLLLNAILSAELFKTSHDDVQLIVLPLFHIFAMTTLMNAGIYRASKNVLLPRFEAPAAFSLMQKHEVTIFAGVPTMYWGMVHAEGDFDFEAVSRTLRVAVSGGASLPIQVLEDFEAKFKVPIMEGYGMSEGSPVVSFNQMDTGLKPGSVGTPVWGSEVKIVDDEDNELPTGERGQLIYRGHNVMKGYYKRPEINREVLKGGWMHSGDVAYKDEDGFIFIVDRTKDMIIRGGLNVYPREVEEVMMKHEAVSLVAVIGKPDEEMGEEVHACVVCNVGKQIPADELIAWTKERLAAYKYPRTIEYLESLPMSATGKILKKELRS